MPSREPSTDPHAGHQHGALPGDALPGDALPGGALPGDALPGGALPGDALPGGALPGDAEAFPRAAVRDLIGEGLAAQRRREFAQDAAIALGLALLALGLPTERLLGEGPLVVQWTDQGRWTSIHLVMQPLAQLLARLPSIGAERAWYLISALCWAGTYPVLVRTSQALGYSRLAAGASALVCLVSPVAFLSATLPGPSGPALLGSALLLGALIRAPARAQPGAGALRPARTWGAVCLLDPNLLLLLPAVLWHGWMQTAGQTAARRRVATAAAVGLGLLAAVWVAAGSAFAGDGPAATAQGLKSRLLGSAGVGSQEGLIWLLMLGPALGAGLVGLLELFRRPEGAQATPPAWLAAFVGVPILVKFLGGAPNLDTGAWVLAPLCAVGLAGYVERLPEGRRVIPICILCAVQILLNFGIQAGLRTGDPSRDWVARASAVLEPGDIVVTRNQMHDYLLRHRFQVRTINLRVPVELEPTRRPDWWMSARELLGRHARAGGRLVVDWKVGEPLAGSRDYPFESELHELVLLAPVMHLDPEGEEREDFGKLKLPVTFEPDRDDVPAALKRP